jgi:hypothetical protein
MAVRNHLAMLGMPVPGSREVLPVVESIKVVQLPAVPPTLLHLGLPLAQCGVLPVQGVPPPVLSLGGLQEGAVHALPHLQGVGGLDAGQGLLQDSLNTFPCQEPLNHQRGSSVWKRLFVSKPQSFLSQSTPVVKSSPWSVSATPSTWSFTTPTTPSATSVSADALQSRVTASLPAPVSVSARDSVLTSGSLQLPPFTRTGPLGVEGESVTLEELNIRSKPLVQSFAWDSLSVGSKKVYTLNWKLFSNFGLLHGCDVNKFKWDFSFVCEYLLFRIQNSGSIHSVLSARSALNFYWKLGSSEPSTTESHFVSLFIKGHSRKFKHVPKQAFPISYADLCKILNQTLGDSTLET